MLLLLYYFATLLMSLTFVYLANANVCFMAVQFQLICRMSEVFAYVPNLITIKHIIAVLY